MAPKRTIGIFSNYDATEKTLCALYMTKHVLLQRYHHVAWIIPDDIKPTHRYFGFSHEWDAATLSLESQEKKVIEVLSQPIKISKGAIVPACEICFFFDENDHLFSLLPKTTKTVLFVDHHKWDQDKSKVFAKKCNYLLTPGIDVIRAIRQPGVFLDSDLCPFNPTVQLIPKVSILSGQGATLFYPAYDLTFMERQTLQQITEIVKECCPNSKSVIGYYDTKEKSEPGRDARTYDWKLLEYLKRTDWIVDLNPRPLMGLFGAFAGALGIQWSCLDVPPHNDDYSAARRHLIPYPKGGLILKNAEEIAGHIVRQLLTPFNDDMDRNKRVESYFKRLKVFYRRAFAKK